MGGVGLTEGEAAADADGLSLGDVGVDDVGAASAEAVGSGANTLASASAVDDGVGSMGGTVASAVGTTTTSSALVAGSVFAAGVGGSAHAEASMAEMAPKSAAV